MDPDCIGPFMTPEQAEASRRRLDAIMDTCDAIAGRPNFRAQVAAEQLERRAARIRKLNRVPDDEY